MLFNKQNVHYLDISRIFSQLKLLVDLSSVVNQFLPALLINSKK